MTKKTAKAQFTPILSGTAPGSYLPSPELARANEFARMLFDLEQSIEDRNATPAALREAVSTYLPEFAGHARDLLESIAFVEAGHRKPSDLEKAIEAKIEFMRSAVSAVLSFSPRHPDEAVIHATALHLANTAAADRHRVRYSNY